MKRRLNPRLSDPKAKLFENTKGTQSTEDTGFPVV
jgi:hypothetical protein